MKNKIALVLALSMCISITQPIMVYGEASDEPKTSEKKSVEIVDVINLTIADAMQYAKDNSRAMWRIDDGLRKAKDMKSKVNSAKNAAELMMDLPLEYTHNMNINITDGYVEALLAKNDYYKTQAETTTLELEKQKDQLNIGLEVGAKASYYQALATEKTIESNEKSLNRAKEQLKVIELKFDNGSATKAEVLNGEMSVQKAQTELDSSLDSFEIAKLNLSNTLGLPLGTRLILVDKDLSYVATNAINIEEGIEAAKNERPEILSVKNKLLLQEIRTHVETAYYTSNLREHKAALQELEDAKINIDKTNEAIELDVRTKYQELVKAERALLNMDKTLELAKEASRINKLLYDNGMASALEVFQADTDLQQAEIGKYNLLVAYNVSKMMFDNANILGNVSQ